MKTKEEIKFTDKQEPQKTLFNQKPEEKQADEEINKEDRIKELTETLQRLQAEFENFKKRTERETAEFRNYAVMEFIKKLLPVLDNFEIALKVGEAKNLKKGIEMIYAQLTEILEEEGLKPIDALNKKFDPHYHEALMQEDSDKEDGVILEELSKGYMFKEKVLRHTKVKISRNKSNKNSTNSGT